MLFFFFFFFNDPATTEIYTLSLHDALPILETVGDTPSLRLEVNIGGATTMYPIDEKPPSLPGFEDRKSTRLNSSHVKISYAVFCLKKKKKKKKKIHKTTKTKNKKTHQTSPT